MHLEFEDVGGDIGRLKELYAIYETAFPHPDEREPLSVFQEIIALNSDLDAQERFGPYKEEVLALVDSSTRKVVGGLVIGITTSAEHAAAGFRASVQAIYLFMAKSSRDFLRRSLVLNEIEKRALAAFAIPDQSAKDVAVFFEANDPNEMTEDDIREDYDSAGTDTYRRYNAWTRFGYPLNFPYVQPALGSASLAVHFLQLFYMGPGADVSSAMLLNHLYRFISMSVLKGRDANKNADYRPMKEFLESCDRVKFISLDTPRIKKIRSEAEWRAREINNKKRRILFPPIIDTDPEQFSLPLWLKDRILDVFNIIYKLSYKVYHRLERYHIIVSHIELLLGVLGISFLAFGRFYGESFHIFVDRGEAVITAFLSAYLISRAIVSIRRMHLGHRLGKLCKTINRRTSRRAGGAENSFAWLRIEMASNLLHCTAFGAPVSPEVSSERRMQILRRIASYCGQLYSDRVWGITDRLRQEWEYSQLADWTKSFSDGLMAATYDNCPGRVFYSVVLPIETGHASGPHRLDTDQLQIDLDAARNMQKMHSDAQLGRGERAKKAPCFIVLRQVMSENTGPHRRENRLSRQLNIVLTTMLHVTLLLEQIAVNGNIISGVPEGLTLLVMSSNRHNKNILERLGFKLLQRSALYEEIGDNEGFGKTDFSIYRIVFDKESDRDSDAQRLLELLASLQRAFHELKMGRATQNPVRVGSE